MARVRLLRFLTIFAVLFAAISMSGGHSAMAMPVAMQVEHANDTVMSAGHCDDMSQKKKGPANPGIDCMMACSGLPAVGSALGEASIPAALHPPLPLQGRITGVLLEMEPPPPRTM